MKRATLLILLVGLFSAGCKKRNEQNANSCDRLLTELTPTLDPKKVKTKHSIKDGACTLSLRGAEAATEKAIGGFLLANGWTIERTESIKNGTFTAYANDAVGGCSVTANGAADCSSAACYSEFKVTCFPKQE